MTYASGPPTPPPYQGGPPAVCAVTALQAGDLLRNDRSSVFVDGMLVPLLVTDGEWWRLITSGFLHFGAIHVLVNMLALWLLGRDLEVVLGRGRFVAVYMLALLGGSVAGLLF